MSLSLVTCTVVLNRRWGECAALADVQDALSWSAAFIPLSPASVGVITTDDLLAITSATYPQFIDVAEARGLATIVENLDPTNLTAIGVKTDPDKLRLKYQAMLDRKMAFIKQAYAVGLMQLAVGVINLNFAADYDPTSTVPTEF